MRTLLTILLLSSVAFGQSFGGGKSIAGGKSFNGGGHLPSGVASWVQLPGNDGVNVTMPATVSNHQVIVPVLWGSSSTTITSVSDDQSNTYIPVSSSLASNSTMGEQAQIFYCQSPCASGVTSVTVNLSGSVSFILVGAWELAGKTISTSSGFNLSNGTVSSNHCTGTNISASSNNVLIAIGDSDNGFSAIAAPWTIQSITTFATSGYVLNSSGITYTPTFTATGSTNCLIAEAQLN